ncbi:MAG: NADH-quinone oxidoreductase subunit C [Candidatus Omnitrophica bacterium]|nr:NADH-quinone oxidoreductase subunit C [Candidatus Omnitrophota bacterium]
MNNLTEKLKEKCSDAVLEVKTCRNETTVLVNPGDIVNVCRFLHDDEDLAYDYISGISGVDYLGKEPRFAVVYHVYSMKNKNRLTLKVLVPENHSVPSVSSVWRGANWFEREVFDMYGIKFSGHPAMKRILMPDDWTGYPLRKDYPLKGFIPAKWTKQDRPW